MFRDKYQKVLNEAEKIKKRDNDGVTNANKWINEIVKKSDGVIKRSDFEIFGSKKEK